MAAICMHCLANDAMELMQLLMSQVLQWPECEATVMHVADIWNSPDQSNRRTPLIFVNLCVKRHFVNIAISIIYPQ
jgi:hypothetical protein